MPLTLITTAVLAGIELSINKLLSLDTTSQEKLKQLDGAVLAIQSLSPSLEIFIIVRDSSLRLSSYYEDTPDTIISGTSNALIHLLLSHNDSQAFYHEDLSVQGNLDLVQSLQKILITLNIDWEYHLSKFIGDIPTQSFSDSLHSFKKFSDSTTNNLILDLDEYIHEEKRLFPSSNELNTFYQAVDNIKLKIDRAEARLNILSHKD